MGTAMREEDDVRVSPAPLSLRRRNVNSCLSSVNLLPALGSQAGIMMAECMMAGRSRMAAAVAGTADADSPIYALPLNEWGNWRRQISLQEHK